MIIPGYQGDLHRVKVRAYPAGHWYVKDMAFVYYYQNTALENVMPVIQDAADTLLNMTATLELITLLSVLYEHFTVEKMYWDISLTLGGAYRIMFYGQNDQRIAIYGQNDSEYAFHVAHEPMSEHYRFRCNNEGRQNLMAGLKVFMVSRRAMSA